MSAEQKQEKKIMDEKIAKVRSVVNNVSTNTIVLVLHHYEMNVEKTIQAFLQGTYNEILDDWEQLPGGASTKSKNAKKKKSKAATKSTDSGSLASGKSTPSALKPVNESNNNNRYHVAAPTAIPPASVATAAVNNGVTVKETKPVQQNGAQPAAASSSSTSSKKKSKSKQTGAATAEVAPVSADELARFQALDDAAKLSAIAAEVSQLSSYASDLDKLEDAFNSQISHSQTNILQCFLASKQLLSERECQLSAELAQCRDEAATLFNSRRAKLIDLSGKAIAPPKAAKEREILYKELKSFNAAKAYDKSVANATRFHVDSASLHAAIARFGEVVPTKSSSKPSGNEVNGDMTTAPTKSTLVSGASGKTKEPVQPPKQKAAEPKANGHHSVANDGSVEKLVPPSHASEVNDVSPDLSPKAEAKKMMQVTTSGIQMQSTGLSADQLVALQKQIEETLRSKGIDPSVFADVGGKIVAPRKRPPPKNSNNNGEKRASGRDGGKNAGGKSQPHQVKLSIMS